jgi:hypothetical protein
MAIVTITFSLYTLGYQTSMGESNYKAIMTLLMRHEVLGKNVTLELEYLIKDKVKG